MTLLSSWKAPGQDGLTDSLKATELERSYNDDLAIKILLQSCFFRKQYLQIKRRNSPIPLKNSFHL